MPAVESFERHIELAEALAQSTSTVMHHPPQGSGKFDNCDVLHRELAHRVKNMFAMTQAIARQTWRSTPDPEQFLVAFMGRISSLSTTFNLLTEDHWHGRQIETVIEHQLSPLVGETLGRIRTGGPSIFLPANSATQLGLVLHELGTNAVKFGGLSNQSGCVHLTWTVSGHEIRVMWRESGGPPVTPPAGAGGFGSKLIAMSVQHLVRRYLRDGFQMSFTLLLPDLPGSIRPPLGGAASSEPNSGRRA